MPGEGDEESKSVMGIPLKTFVLVLLLIVFFAILLVIFKETMSNALSKIIGS